MVDENKALKELEDAGLTPDEARRELEEWKSNQKPARYQLTNHSGETREIKEAEAVQILNKHYRNPREVLKEFANRGLKTGHGEIRKI